MFGNLVCSIVKQMRDGSICWITFNEEDLCVGKHSLDAFGNIVDIVSRSRFSRHPIPFVLDNARKLGEIKFIWPPAVPKEMKFFLQWPHELWVTGYLLEERRRPRLHGTDQQDLRAQRRLAVVPQFRTVVDFRLLLGSLTDPLDRFESIDWGSLEA